MGSTAQEPKPGDRVYFIDMVYGQGEIGATDVLEDAAHFHYTDESSHDAIEIIVELLKVLTGDVWASEQDSEDEDRRHIIYKIQK